MKKKLLIIGIVYFVILVIFSFNVTHSYFSDSGTSTNNVFAAASVFPTPTPLPLQAGDVIINELNWAGSSIGSADEWIELKNTTNHTINIGNWQITKWVTSSGGQENLMLTIPSSASISANGYFLIVDKSPGQGSALNVTPDVIDSSVVLDNSNLQVKLYQNNWNSGGLLLDTAGNKNAPLAGQHTGRNNKTFFSMERNSTPGDGTQAANWHTATTSVNLNSDNGQNKGTPRTIND